jgi:hypothetical protein
MAENGLIVDDFLLARSLGALRSNIAHSCE